jgi:hypothetical protein
LILKINRAGPFIQTISINIEVKHITNFFLYYCFS